MFRFRFYFSHCRHRRRMRTYQNTAFAVLYRYDIFYGGHQIDAGVGSGRRRRFFYLYGFCFSTTLWNVFVIEPRDSLFISVIQKVPSWRMCGAIPTLP